MPAGGDIIELTHEQSYLGQQVNNVYFFEAVDGTASLTALAAWFETNMVPAIKQFQNDLCLHYNLRLRNLFDAGETYEEPLTGGGAGVSGALELPSFFAVTMRLDHTSGEVRNGFKRWSGLDEGAVADAILTAAMITNMAVVGELLMNPPSVTNTGWAHVIIGRVCAEPNPTPGAVPSCLRYRLPETQAEAAAAGVAYPVEYAIYAQPTTQNSRKWYT